MGGAVINDNNVHCIIGMSISIYLASFISIIHMNLCKPFEIERKAYQEGYTKKKVGGATPTFANLASKTKFMFKK